jgi:hypothetical protein
VLSLVAGAMLCVGCCYLGIGVKNVYKTRMIFYKDFLQFIGELKGEIEYLKTPLLDFTEGF